MPRSVFDAVSLSAFIYFLAQVNLGFEILDRALLLAGSSPCRLRQLWTCSSVELERDFAKVEGVRSNRTRSTISSPCNLCVLCVSVVN